MEPIHKNHDRAHLRFMRDRNNLKLCKILFKNMISLEKIMEELLNFPICV